MFIIDPVIIAAVLVCLIASLDIMLNARSTYEIMNVLSNESDRSSSGSGTLILYEPRGNMYRGAIMPVSFAIFFLLLYLMIGMPAWNTAQQNIIQYLGQDQLLFLSLYISILIVLSAQLSKKASETFFVITDQGIDRHVGRKKKSTINWDEIKGLDLELPNRKRLTKVRFYDGNGRMDIPVRIKNIERFYATALKKLSGRFDGSSACVYMQSQLDQKS